MSDTATHGRVDADGTVFVRLADGTEVSVGQYQAGTPLEGLAFYQRKYDDLKIEAELFLRRLKDGRGRPDGAKALISKLTSAVTTPNCVGDLTVFTSLAASIEAAAGERAEQLKAEREVARAAALQTRMDIAMRAEMLADSTAWKSTADSFKELLEEWQKAPHAERAAEQDLWKRFSAARNSFEKRRRAHFLQRDAERAESKAVRTGLVKEAQQLAQSTDWAATAKAFGALMARWKAAPRGRRQEDDALWEQFKAAQDAFFDARNADLEKRDEQHKGNLVIKEELLAQAQALLPVTDANIDAVKQALRGIAEKWEKAGHVPRADKDRLEGGLRKVEEAVRNHERDRWRRTNPEARDRAYGVVEQFRASLAKLDADIANATEARAKADLEKRRATTALLLEAAENAAKEYA
ncbi:MAG: DUF349 domain-containing protein [Actinomycetales bacterium]|nr:DUF349 domain-containing protein [Actinomycetales bacterium]